MSVPTDTPLKYIPITKETTGVVSCGNPIELNLSKILPGNKVIITGAPGAFTPTCTEEHIPDYLKHIEDFKKKGVSKVIVLTANDPFVTSAWGKALGYTDEENYFIFASDYNAEFSKKLGGDDYGVDLSKAGLGIRTGRYVALIDDGKLTLIENEDGLGYSAISSAKTILDKL